MIGRLSNLACGLPSPQDSALTSRAYDRSPQMQMM